MQSSLERRTRTPKKQKENNNIPALNAEQDIEHSTTTQESVVDDGHGRQQQQTQESVVDNEHR